MPDPIAVTETVRLSNVISVSNKDTFRNDVYLAIIDCLLDELESRFAVKHSAVIKRIQSFSRHYYKLPDLLVRPI